MNQNVSIFINDSEMQINKSATNFKDLLNISNQEMKKIISKAMDAVMDDKTPGESLIDLINVGDFKTVFYLAGLGLSEMAHDLSKNARVHIVGVGHN